MQIVNLTSEDEKLTQQLAVIMVEAFAGHTDAWPDTASAIESIQEVFAAKGICRVAIDDNGDALGWIGGLEQYDGNVWELHPLVVKISEQSKGIGRALVRDLEALVTARGAYTLWLGTDDEDNRTSLGGANMFPNPLEQLANIKNPGRHPYEFYQKLGFVIVGAMPDANGLGKPDIFMAKSLKGR